MMTKQPADPGEKELREEGMNGLMQGESSFLHSLKTYICIAIPLFVFLMQTLAVRPYIICKLMHSH